MAKGDRCVRQKDRETCVMHNKSKMFLMSSRKNDKWKDTLERPCAVESRKPRFRRGAAGKVPKGNSLAVYPTMEQYTKPVEGQHDGQETAATHGGLQVSGCFGSA